MIRVLRTACVLAAMAVAVFPSSHARAAQEWLKGTLHVHTDRTGGDAPLQEVISWHYQRKYDFIVLSDHDVFPEWWGIVNGKGHRMLVLPGEEVSMEDVHIGVVGSRADVRVGGGYTGDEMEKLKGHFRSLNYGEKAVEDNAHVMHHISMLSYVKKQIYPYGGLAFLILANLSYSGIVMMRSGEFTHFELWNTHADAYFPGQTKHDMEEEWDRMLSQGVAYYATAGDDANYFRAAWQAAPGYPGQYWVWVRASDMKPESVIRALKRGDFYISSGVTLEELVMSPSEIRVSVVPQENEVYRVEFVGHEGRLLETTEGVAAVYRPKGDEKYVRVRVFNGQGRKAYSQPLFLPGFEDLKKG